MPSESRFSMYSPKDAQISVSHDNTQTGPKQAQIGLTDTMYGKKTDKT